MIEAGFTYHVWSLEYTCATGELMRLENNQQLYGYLVSIGAKLNTRGETELGRVEMAASRQAAVPSTEFLGESRIALRRVKNEQTVLTEDERSGLEDIMRQLDEAVDRR